LRFGDRFVINNHIFNNLFKHYLLERVGSTNAYDMDHNSDEYLWLVAMVKKIEDYEMSKQVYAIQKAMGFVRD
jgi:hypothetical protein